MKNVYSVTRFLFSFIFIILLNSFFSFDGRTASFSPTADPTMPVTNGEVYSSLIDEDGITYLVGEFDFVGPVEALTGSGVLINTETGKISNNPFPRVEGNIREVISDSKGGWFIFGDFGTVGDLPRNSFAHILPSGLVDPNWELKDDKIQLINIFFNKEDNRLYAIDVYEINKNKLIVINGENGRKIDWKPAIPDGAIFHLIAAGRSGVYVKYLLQGKTKVAHLDSQGKVLWDVELSYKIHKMILSPDENILFMITHGNSDSLSAMNTSNGTIDPKIGFYVRPSLEDVFIDPDKKFLYLVGKISEIEQISTQKKISGLKQVAIVNIDTASAQYGSADESRNININHPADDIRFIHFNPINKKGYGRGFGGPSGLFVLSTSDYNNDKFITKLDLDSPIINKVFVAGDPSFDINPDGKTLYIGGYFLTNQQNQKYLAAIDPQGKLISTFKPELDPRCSPKRVTVIHHPQKGKIVVAAGLPSDSNVCFQGFDMSGKMVFSSQSKQLELSSLTASSDLSRFYLSGDNLEVYDAEGNLLIKDWGQIPGGAWAEGKEGSIYIIGTDQNKVLQLNIFDKSGKLQKNLSGPQLTDGYPTQLLLSPSGEEAYVTLSVHTLLKLNLKDGVLTRDTNFNLGDIKFTQIYSSGKEEYSIFASQTTSDLKLINLNKNGGSGPVESFDLPTSAGGYFNLFSSVNSYNVSKSSVDVTGNFLRIRDEYRPGFARFALKEMTEESPSKSEGSSGSGGGCALTAKAVHPPFEKSALVAFFLTSLVFLTSVRIIRWKRSLSR